MTFLPVPGTLELDEQGKTSVYTITWDELRTAWKRMFIDKTHTLKHNQSHHTIRDFVNGSRNGGGGNDWSGFTMEQAHDWCENGYKPGIEMLQVEAPMQREKRRVRTAEEGEYQHDAALSGFDYPFLSWDYRPGKRGIRVLYDMSIAWNTPAAAIKKYLGWIAEFSHGLEYADLDYSLGFVFGLNHLIVGEYKYSTNDTHIIIKGEDEASSFQSWSSMLSPAAYRGFCFFAAILHAEKMGKRCDGSIGQCRGPRSFQVNLEHDTETIFVQKPHSFYPDDVKPEELSKKCNTLIENPLDVDDLGGY